MPETPIFFVSNTKAGKEEELYAHAQTGMKTTMTNGIGSVTFQSGITLAIRVEIQLRDFLHPHMNH